MAAPKYPGFDTLALHAGQSPDPATGSRAVPVYQTTSYVFRDSEHAASLFNMERAGSLHTVFSNLPKLLNKAKYADARFAFVEEMTAMSQGHGSELP